MNKTKASPYKEQIDFMRLKHKGQRRTGWERPYYYHPLEVAQIVSYNDGSDDEIIAALFHDLLEDTDATEEEILALSNEQVLKAVKLLTKDKTLPNEIYVKTVMENDLTRNIKLADRIANLREAQYSNKTLRKRYLEDTNKYYVKYLEPNLYGDEIYKALEELRQMVEAEGEE